MFVFWALGIYETYQSTRYTYGPFKKTVNNLNELRSYLEEVIQVDPATINDIVETMQFASQLPDQCHEYGFHSEPDQDSIIRIVERETIYVHTIKNADKTIDIYWGGARISKGFRKYQIKTKEKSFLFWSWESDKWAEYVPLTAAEITALNEYLEDTINSTLENIKSDFRNKNFQSDPGAPIRASIKKQPDPETIQKERAGYLLNPKQTTRREFSVSRSVSRNSSSRSVISTTATPTPAPVAKKVLSTKEIKAGVIMETLDDEGTGFGYSRRRVSPSRDVTTTSATGGSSSERSVSRSGTESTGSRGVSRSTRSEATTTSATTSISVNQCHIYH